MVLGVNLNHDYSYCLIDNDKVFLHEAERFSRIRHHLTDDIFTLAILDDFTLEELKLIKGIYLNSPSARKIARKNGDLSSRLRQYQYIGDYVDKNCITGISYGKIVVENIEIPSAWVSHYHAHAASTFWTSPYSKADIICLDGGGDFGEGAIFQGYEKTINLKDRLENIQLGSSYHFFSHKVYGVNTGFYESKVMAMASLGKKELSQNTFMSRNGGLNDINPDAIISVHDIAEFQHQFEQSVLNIIKKNVVKNDYLCCAGGCFLNVSLNRVLADSMEYKGIFIPPYTGDMGTALGCALYAELNINKKLPNKEKLDTPFLGKEIKINIEELKLIIEACGDIAIDKDIY